MEEKNLNKQDEKKEKIKEKKENKRENEKEKEIIFEKRILKLIFLCGILASFFFILSFSTEFWVFVTLKTPEKKFKVERGGEFLKTGHYHGLWRFCRNEIWNGKNSTYCRRMSFDVPAKVKPERLDVETKMADFRRSTVAVGIICLVLSFLSHSFTWYSINQYRYTFKRLAGCLHLITGASCWVVSEVFRQSMLYEEKSMKDHVTEFSQINFGWSFYLVYVCLILFLIPGFSLLYKSKKRKRDLARSLKEAQENEPVYLGRV